MTNESAARVCGASGKVKRMKQCTKKGYEEWLNEIPVPFEDLESNGGRIPDDAVYGTWLRCNDPIAFQVGYQEWLKPIEL